MEHDPGETKTALKTFIYHMTLNKLLSYVNDLNFQIK